MRTIKYVNVLKPSVDYLYGSSKLMLDIKEMAEFLGLPRKAVSQLVYSDRIPLPMRLGLGHCYRWSILELLEWVEAGCPRRREWIEMRGQSGWYPIWKSQP